MIRQEIIDRRVSPRKYVLEGWGEIKTPLDEKADGKFPSILGSKETGLKSADVLSASAQAVITILTGKPLDGDLTLIHDPVNLPLGVYGFETPDYAGCLFGPDCVDPAKAGMP